MVYYFIGLYHIRRRLKALAKVLPPPKVSPGGTAP